MIARFAHVCFIVRDLEASVAFYCDKLGFTRAFDFVNDKGERFGVYLHIAGRVFIELFQGERTGGGPGQSYQHMCLEVADIQAAVGELREGGVDIGEVTLGSDNSWQAWLEDPDGNKIELHCYTPESRQAPWLR